MKKNQLHKFLFMLLAYLSVAFSSNAQLPLSEGDIAVTFRKGMVGGMSTTSTTVLATLKSAATNTATPGNVWTLPGAGYGGTKPIWYSDPSWTATNLGDIFGLTLDNYGNIIVSSSQIYFGAISNKIYQINGVTGAITTIINSTAVGSFGNIKFTEINGDGYIYFSDWGNGLIHCMKRVGNTNSATWVTQPSFDPEFGRIGGGLNDNNNLRKQLPYGLAIRNTAGGKKLFYSRIGYSYGYNNPGANLMTGSLFENEIWSVDLNASGGVVTSSETKQTGEYLFGSTGTYYFNNNNNPNGGSIVHRNPIADIAFSADGKRMLVGQQSLNSLNSLDAHASEVGEFVEINPNEWAWSGKRFPTGTATTGTPTSQSNAVGGVSYSNNVLYGTATNKHCDTTVWAVTDGINYSGITGIPTPPLVSGGGLPNVYGVMGYKSNGIAPYNGTPGSLNYGNALLLDEDDDYSYHDKYFLGDVEAFKNNAVCTSCGCGHWDSSFLFNENPISTMPGTNTLGVTIPSAGTGGLVFVNYHCNDTACNASYQWTISNAVPAVVASGTSMPVNLGSYTSSMPCGVYNLVIKAICGGSICDSVVIRITIQCPPVCVCDTGFHFNGNPIAQAGTFISDQFVTNGSPISIPCINTQPIQLNCNTTYAFYIPFSNPYTAPCVGKDSAVIVKNGTTVVASNSNCSSSAPLYYTFTTSGNYCVKHYLVINGQRCDSCITCYTVNCPCLCTPNFRFNGNPRVQAGTLNSGQFIGTSGIIQEPCGQLNAGNLQCNTLYGFSIPFTNPYVAPCVGKDSAVIIMNGTSLVASNPNCSISSPMTYTFTSSGNYCIIHYLTVNGRRCDSCITCYTVSCDTCNCSKVTYFGRPTISWNIAKAIGGTLPYTVVGECNTSIARELSCGTPYNFSIGANITGGCPYTLVTEITRSGSTTVIASQTNTSNLNAMPYTFTSSGVYCVTYKIYIGGVLCKTCTLCFKVCCWIYNPVPTDVIIGTARACKIGEVTQLRHDSTGGTWLSNDTSVAVVHPSAGYVIGKKAGITQIIYVYPKYPCGWHWVAIDYTVDIMNTPSATTLSNTTVCVGNNITATNSTTIPQGGRAEWSSISGRATISPSGLITGTSAGTGTARYTVFNSFGCSSFIDKTFSVAAIPAVPTIGYAAGTVNPQAGCPGGVFGKNRTFTVVGTPTGGTWSATGQITITQTGACRTSNTNGAGSVTYTVSSSAGCTSSRTINGAVGNCAAKGLTNIESTTKFTVYPNPTKDVLNINISNGASGKIICTDVYGKTIKQQMINIGSNSIDVKGFAKGTYFISVVTNNNTSTAKFIVEY